MNQEIRFCTASDGVRLAYCKVGQGPPLVKTANMFHHLEYDWSSPLWRPWLEGWSRYHTLYRYDQRGCGRSDWDVSDFSFERLVDDLEQLSMRQVWRNSICLAYRRAVRLPLRMQPGIRKGS